jgi:hypothetical protein
MKNRKLSIMALVPLMLVSCTHTLDVKQASAVDINSYLVRDANTIVVGVSSDKATTITRGVGYVVKTVDGVLDGYGTDVDNFETYAPDWNAIFTEGGDQLGNYTVTYRVFDGFKAEAKNKAGQACGTVLYDFQIGPADAEIPDGKIAFSATVNKYVSTTDDSKANLTFSLSGKVDVAVDYTTCEVAYTYDDTDTVAKEYVDYSKALVDGLYQEGKGLTDGNIKAYTVNAGGVFYGHTFFDDGAGLKELNLEKYTAVRDFVDKTFSGATTKFFATRANVYLDDDKVTTLADQMYNNYKSTATINNDTYSTMAGDIERPLETNHYLSYQIHYDLKKLFDVNGTTTYDTFKAYYYKGLNNDIVAAPKK